MKNKIILTAEADLVDQTARDLLKSLSTKIDTINERTKTIYVYLRDFEKRMSLLEKKKSQNQPNVNGGKE